MTHRRSPSHARARLAPALHPEPLERRLLLAGDLVHSIGQLPTARQDMLAVTVGNDAIFAGGVRNPRRNYNCAEVDVYDARRGRWYASALPVAPVTATGDPVAAAAGHVVFDTAPSLTTNSITQYVLFDASTGQSTMLNRPGGDRAGVYATEVAVGSKVVTAGGYWTISLADQILDQTEVIDPAAGTIDDSHHMADPGIPYAAVVGDKVAFVDRTAFLFAHGGYAGSSVAEVYDATANQWSTTALPTPHTNLAIAVVDNVALFAGGQAETLNGHLANPFVGPSAAVDIFHADTGQFTAASLSLARTAITSASVGHYAVFAGGVYYALSHPGRDFAEPTVDLYNAQTDQWSTATLSVPRVLAQSAVAGNVALFYGGALNDKRSRPATVDVFDASANQWSVTTMPLKLVSPQSVVVGNEVIFYSPGDTTIEAYDTVAGTWSTSQLSSARTNMAVTSVNDTALFAGGATAKALSNTVDIFTVAALSATAAARHGVFAAATRHPWDSSM